MSHRPALPRLRDERGFTLMETLVAIFAGLIVTFATFAILDISLSQSARIADRVSANQRARIAMEKIVLELHSSCVAPKTTPVEPNSEANKLLIVSNTGPNASFATVTLHEIYLKEEKEKGKYQIIDAAHSSTGAKQAPEWEFSEKPSSTQTLLTGLSRSLNKEKKEIPFFQYYKYEGSKLSETPQKTPLTAIESEETAAIAVSFTTAPETGNVGKVENDRTVDLSDTVVLRFSPASPTGNNLPCA